MILSAVVAEGDAMESDGLEVKSELNLTKRGVGIARVAKFILGMAPLTALGSTLSGPNGWLVHPFRCPSR